MNWKLYQILCAKTPRPGLLQEKVVQRIRVERIKQSQDDEMWIQYLKLYLIGFLATLSSAEEKTTALIAPDYEVDNSVTMLSSLYHNG